MKLQQSNFDEINSRDISIDFEDYKFVIILLVTARILLTK